MVLAFFVTSAAAEPIIGTARVIDGDTIEIRGERIRLEGIDAPEAAQSCRRDGSEWPCGALASSVLRSMISGRDVTCAESGRDRWNRMLAVCEVGGSEINAAMVRSGYALAFRRYSDRYAPQEEAAKAAGVGVWSGEFVAPWDHRAAKRAR